MSKEKEKIRVIKVFDNEDDVINDIRSHKDEPGMLWSLGEDAFLMNVANFMCHFILQYEAGLISKDELDLYLGKKDCLSNINPLEFNFLLVSTINGCTYRSRPYYIDKKTWMTLTLRYWNYIANCPSCIRLTVSSTRYRKWLRILRQLTKTLTK